MPTLPVDSRALLLLHTDFPPSTLSMQILREHEGLASIVHTGSRTDLTDLARRFTFDLIILDVRGQEEETLPLIARLNQLGFAGRVLVLLPEVNSQRAIHLLEAGVAGVLTQQNGLAVLTGTVREILAARKRNGTSASNSGRRAMTERQRLVFRCVADGLTNKEIADQLKISVGTVKATLQQLFTRTGVHSRSYLVRRALTREMVGTT